ncbi:hypothetical protein GQ600_6330 [Phytophthora cactorum]|nr:hypothetical protein GQ600_6330 [Phytophthora cactorum]
MRYTCCAWPRFPSFELKNPSAKRTPLKPSHLKIRRIPDRPHAASQKNGISRSLVRAQECGLVRDEKPTGLSDDHTYLKPENTYKDTRSEDYFVGEEELMHYLDKCDLAAIPAKKKARRKVSASAARRFVATEAAKSNTTATAAGTEAVCCMLHM